MRILLASASLSVLGGSETYLLTLGRHLERLGHDVTFVEAHGSVGGLVNDAGLVQIATPSDLDKPPDRVVAQDAIVAAEVAAAWPTVPQLFVSHSVIHDVQLTDALPSTIAAIVALNDRSAARAQALARNLPVIRLRQPVDVGHFTPGPPPHEVPLTLMLFGNYSAEWRTSPLRHDCERRGIEVLRIGGEARIANPVVALQSADIVVGYGRCVLEAMACGRTVLVLDRFGSDGWATAETYPVLEASGFNGSAGLDLAGRDDFAELLDLYSPRTGAELHDIAYRNHDARKHAAAILEQLECLGPVEPADRGLSFALARTWRQQWYWENQAIRYQQLSYHLREAEAAIADLRQQLADAHAENERLRVPAASGSRLGRELASVLGSRRYRLGASIADAALAPKRAFHAIRSSLTQ